MTLPEIPESWNKFVGLIMQFAILLLVSLGYIQTRDNGSVGQVVVQKQDAAAEKVVVTEQKIDALHVVAEKTAAKIGASK